MKDYEEMNVDYEELMLQVSDVMREANRLRPILSHEQAIKNIRGIVERHGEWKEHEDEKWGGVWYTCSNCNQNALYEQDEYNNWRQKLSDFCPDCGARMDL